MRHRTIIVLSSLLVAMLLAFGPCAVIPGGSLDGELVTEPVDDWSFIGESTRCQIEVRPEDPHSITVNCRQADGRLYVGAMRAPGKRWPEMVAADPRVRVRINGKLYERRAIRITDEAERMRVFGGTAEEPPAANHWLWRLDSR